MEQHGTLSVFYYEETISERLGDSWCFNVDLMFLLISYLLNFRL